MYGDSIRINHLIALITIFNCTKDRDLVGKGLYSLSLHPSSILFVYASHLAVSYLFTRLAECSVDPGVSHDTRKLDRILRGIYI